LPGALFVIVANSIGLLCNIITLYYDVRVIIGGDVNMSLVIGVARSSGLLVSALGEAIYGGLCNGPAYFKLVKFLDGLVNRDKGGSK